MRKAVKSLCRSGLSAAVMLMLLGASCKAETSEKEQVDDPAIEVQEAGAIAVERRPNRVMIHVNRPQEKIWTSHHYVSICAHDGCDGDGFQWEIVGGLRDGEMMEIEGIDGYPSCFPKATIQPPHDGAESGPPQCDGTKYGTFWPYNITLTRPDGPPITTDPGAIIHP